MGYFAHRKNFDSISARPADSGRFIIETGAREMLQQVAHLRAEK